ncbi:RhoGAP domain containing protein [Histomonas meleagridis]|uniref:RhoGAP domain containing protein n=1 Tax=Histomonas meleagridis TaxID=135588 RepID=UPI00355AA117|nr:RhoGAP domain containing protein [Histomonas meleagridis]KAH0797976.1 RhoGAP domain containing protein [Histomonas meleagridis]
MISQKSSDRTIFYLFTSSKGKNYFHDPVKNEVFWDVPYNSIIYDGKTNQQINYEQANPNGPKISSPSGHNKLPPMPSLNRRAGSQPKLTPVRRRQRKATLFSCETKVTSDLPPYLPPSILTDKDTVPFQDFAQKNFRKTGKKKSRSDLFVYDENTNLIPLLDITDSKLVKKSVSIFTFIVHYMNDSESTPISQLIHIVNESSILIDEIYVQLLRQVYSCKSNDAIYRGWDLILVMCTLLIPTPKVQSLVRSFLSTYSFDNNKVVARISRLSYLRFVSLIKGKPPREVNDTYIDTIIENKLRHLFGSSLYEILYVQNIYSYNNSPLPVFLQTLCDALISRDVFHTDGIFQVTIEAKRLNSLVFDIESGKDVLQYATVLELGSLLKKFISELQPPLISIADVKDVPIDDVPKVADNLPKVQKDALAYLVQFIRRFCTEGNKDVEPYAMLFGSNILQTRDLASDCMKEYVQLAKSTMQKLIADWDVGFLNSNKEK